MKPLDAVMAKVLHLRNLAQSQNVHEAAAAAAAAERLFAQYGIDEAELEAKRGATDGPSDDDEPLVTWHGPAPVWMRVLGAVLAEHYGCVIYRDVAGRGRARTTRLFVFGRASDRAVLRFTYAWLEVELARLGAARPRRERGTYLHGAVHGVIVAMRRARDKERRRATSSALVLLEGRLAKSERAFAEAHPDASDAPKVRKPKREDLYAAGYIDGQVLGEKRPAGIEESTGPRGLK